MEELLNQSQIQDALANSTWVLNGQTLVLDTEHSDFEAAWAFASQVADAAERANHHPDILVHSWNKSQIVLSTHSAGGITQLDLDLAQAIDAFRA